MSKQPSQRAARIQHPSKMASRLSSPGLKVSSNSVIGWPNALTISRFFMAPVVFWLVLRAEDDKGASWGLVVMACAVALSDALDGWLARHYQVESRLGAFLDPFADKVVVLGCAACFVAVGRYWWLPVALIWLRDIGMSVLRVFYARKGISLPARKLAKWKVALQGTTLTAAALLPLKDLDELHTALIWASVAITFYTGAQYVWDGRPQSSEISVQD